jgi:hypothetical protein
MLRQFQGHFEPADHERLLRHSKRKGQSAAEYLRRALKVQLDVDDAVDAGAASEVPLRSQS